MKIPRSLERNLQSLSRFLGQRLELDERGFLDFEMGNHTVFFAYEPTTTLLVIFSPLPFELPPDPEIRLKLYERLLVGSFIGHQMLCGGIGRMLGTEYLEAHLITSAQSLVKDDDLKTTLVAFLNNLTQWIGICEAILAGGEGKPYEPQLVEQPLMAVLSDRELNEHLSLAEQGQLDDTKIAQLTQRLLYFPRNIDAQKIRILLLMQHIQAAKLNKAEQIAREVGAEDASNLEAEVLILAAHLKASIAIMQLVQIINKNHPVPDEMSLRFKDAGDAYKLLGHQSPFLGIFLLFRIMYSLTTMSPQELVNNTQRITNVRKLLASLPENHYLNLLIPILTHLNALALHAIHPEQFSIGLETPLSILKGAYDALAENYFSSDHFFLTFIRRSLEKLGYPQEFQLSVIPEINGINDAARLEQYIHAINELMNAPNGNLLQAARYSKRAIRILLSTQKIVRATEIVEQITDRFLAFEDFISGAEKAQAYLQSILTIWEELNPHQQRQLSIFAKNVLLKLLKVVTMVENPENEDASASIAVQITLIEDLEQDLGYASPPVFRVISGAGPSQTFPPAESDPIVEERYCSDFEQAKKLIAATEKQSPLLRYVFIPTDSKDLEERCGVFNQQIKNLRTLQSNIQETICFFAQHPTMPTHCLIGLLTQNNLLLIDPQGQADDPPRDFQELCLAPHSTEFRIFFANLALPFENFLPIASDIICRMAEDDATWENIRDFPVLVSEEHYTLVNITSALSTNLKKLISSDYDDHYKELVTKELQAIASRRLEDAQSDSAPEQSLLEQMYRNPADSATILPAFTELQRARSDHQSRRIPSNGSPSTLPHSPPGGSASGIYGQQPRRRPFNPDKVVEALAHLSKKPQ